MRVVDARQRLVQYKQEGGSFNIGNLCCLHALAAGRDVIRKSFHEIL
jgi:hypothetical protein